MSKSSSPLPENVVPSALAVLRKLGFSVSHFGTDLLEASKPGYRLMANDPMV
jgi:hypothetical protein